MNVKQILFDLFATLASTVIFAGLAVIVTALFYIPALYIGWPATIFAGLTIYFSMDYFQSPEFKEFNDRWRPK